MDELIAYKEDLSEAHGRQKSKDILLNRKEDPLRGMTQ